MKRHIALWFVPALALALGACAADSDDGFVSYGAGAKL
jgi:hypothetical protein